VIDLIGGNVDILVGELSKSGQNQSRRSTSYREHNPDQSGAILARAQVTNSFHLLPKYIQNIGITTKTSSNRNIDICDGQLGTGYQDYKVA
jgi:hypothetical protein